MRNQRKIGAFLSYVAQFIQIVVNLVYTPIMLRLVGQSEYGLYQMVYSVVSYLNLLSFGFNSAYIRYYSRYRAASDEEGIASLNGMFLVIFSCIAAIAGIAGSGLVGKIEVVLGKNLTEPEMATARVLMILMVVNLMLTFPSSVFDCYVTSQEAFLFQKLTLIVQQILNPVVALPLLMLGYGSVALIGVTTFLTIGKLLVNIYYCIGRLHMRISFRGMKLSLLREMGTFTFFIFLGQIIDQINWSVDKFLLGRYIGTISVAVYGVAGTMNTMYMQFSTAVSNVFVPKINALVAEGKDDWKLTELFSKVGRIQFFILALILIGFTTIGRPFIYLWGGEEYGKSYAVALLLMLPVTIPLIQNLGIEIQRAKNMHQTRSIVYFWIAVANVLLSIPLIQNFGEIGAALGTAISLFMGNCLFMNWYYHKRIGLNIWYFWKQILIIFPSLLLPILVGVWILLFAQITSWLQLVLYGLLIVAVYSGSVYMLGLNSDEKEMVHSVMRRFVRKKEKP